MPLTPIQTILIILAITLGTMLTRFAPFVLFPEKKKPPKIILDLGQLLPPAMMGLMVVYCLRNVSLFSGTKGLPEFLAIGVTVVLHLWKRNVLLSIGAGTALYVFLVQVIF